VSIIRVGIIGQGRSGRDIHGAYLATAPDRFAVVAAVDPLPERRARAEAEYGCATFAAHGEMLAACELDLVVNATPSRLHVPITLECLEAGFHTLCEKPLAQRAADVDRLIAVSQASGRLLAIFQQSRYSPVFLRIQEVIASGVLGEVVQANIAYDGFQRRYDWQTLTSEMGGNLLNTGPHPLDQALQLFDPEAEPQVFAVMRHVLSKGDADDHTMLVLHGPGRPTIRLQITNCRRLDGPTYEVYGTQGGLRASMSSAEWEWFDPEAAPKVELVREPLCKPDGTPSYCADPLEWNRDTWQAPEGFDTFRAMVDSTYTMLHRTLTEGFPLEITPQQVRRQIAVIEEAQRQNPQIYPDA
jgi:predicted dehydrogenase